MQRLIALFIISLALAFIIYPSAVLHPLTSLPDNNDSRLIAYLIGQSQANLLHRQPLFYAHFFAPYENTLTYSEPFITTALLTLPLHFFTSSPIASYNLAYFIAFVLTFITSFYLFDYLFRDHFISFLTTLLFNLSGFHLVYLPHLQIFSLWLVCLSWLFFLRYLTENRLKFLFLFYLSLTAQLADSLFPAYLIFFGAFCLFLTKRRPLTTIILASLPFVLVWFGLIFPYFRLHFSFSEATRPIRDAAHFSLGLEEILTKYHSWTVLLLLPLSLILPTKTSQKPFWLAALWSLLTIGLVLSLGPVVKFLGHSVKIAGLPLPLPYTLFYYLFPGFKGLRTPSRFILLALLAAVIIIGHHLQPLFTKLKPSTKIIFLLFVLSLLLFEARLPQPGYAVDATPPTVYTQVTALPQKAVILELPLKLWNWDGHQIESLRSLYSLVHGHRRFGGYSGFAPLAWIKLVEAISAYGLDETNLRSLRQLGITHIVENNLLLPLP